MDREESLWRPHAGLLAGPTLSLALVIAGLELCAWVAVGFGLLPTWAGFVLATTAAYLAFTVMHEAAHGNIHGNRRDLAWLGTLLGWVSGLVLLAPYPAFRVLHLRHHSYTNDPQRDPDFFVAGPAPLAFVKALFTIPAYYREFLLGPTSFSREGRRQRPQVLAGLAGHLMVAAAGSLIGHGELVLMLWLLPAVAATTLLAFLFDWLPHRHHDRRGRYHDTRAIDHWVLDVLMLGQNLHLVHHLYPRVPWFRYRAVFNEGQEHFRARGGRVERWVTLVS